ncbi:hypothetical protein Taro_021046 [Colocasia esculenta]|uniref:Expansin n=1 Tax=Colocasia esculenta TaxID=4460 RepID=A0A843UQ94_COLES|nr:hypothetical protein [Colocasia esculenta]
MEAAGRGEEPEIYNLGGASKMGRSVEAAALLMAAALLILSAASGHEWKAGHATFYGNIDPRESQKGACGYDDVFTQGYGNMTAALSTALFNDGLTCGACYELRCYDDPQWCLPGTITVTATNFCPPSDKPSTAGGWCNPPLRHFDLNMPAFLRIARYRAGIVPVHYRRVPCVKTGGVKFEMQGNKDWIAVLVYNVAGAGDVRWVAVKGTWTDWIAMERSWGQIWSVQSQSALVGQELSFRVTTSDGRTVQSDGVATSNWQFGRTYEGKQF